MTMSLAILLLAAASPNTSAPADGATKAEGSASVQIKPKKPKKICRSIAVTGSRLGKRECKTQEEWDGNIDGDLDNVSNKSN